MPETLPTRIDLSDPPYEVPYRRALEDGFFIYRDVIDSPALALIAERIGAIGMNVYRPNSNAELHMRGVARLEVTSSKMLNNFVNGGGGDPVDIGKILLEDATEALIEDDPTLCDPIDVVIGGMDAVRVYRMMTGQNSPNSRRYNNRHLAGFLVRGDIGSHVSLRRLRTERNLAHYSLAEETPPDSRRVGGSKWQPRITLAHVDTRRKTLAEAQARAERSVAEIGDERMLATLGPAYITLEKPDSKSIEPLSGRQPNLRRRR